METRRLPGSLYQRAGRWWWHVRLPGDDHYSSVPLKPPGSRFATSDRSVATELAHILWKRALRSGPDTPAPTDGTLASLVALYQSHCEEYYRGPSGQPTGEAANVSHTLSSLTEQFGAMQAADFGPVHLKRFRQGMIEDDLARTTINQRVGHVRRCFRWLASEGHIDASAAYALTVVDGLRAGRSEAREPGPVGCADDASVQITRTFASATVSAMIELQRLTGMRTGELVIMRPVDIDTSSSVWLYRPETHKTSWRGMERVIAIGPTAQIVLKPFLARRVNAYCFSPVEALAQHHKRRGDKPGRHRRDIPQIQPGDRYDRRGYYQAIQHALRAARKAELLKPKPKRRVIASWHPHQLRHTWLTRVRAALGPEATRAAGGHKSMRMVDRYAELDMKLAMEAAKKLG